MPRTSTKMAFWGWVRCHLLGLAGLAFAMVVSFAWKGGQSPIRLALSATVWLAGGLLLARGDAFLLRFASRPAWVFAWLASIAGVLLVFMVPPFQVPDENNHFLRAYQVSDGMFYWGAATNSPLPAELLKLREVDFFVEKSTTEWRGWREGFVVRGSGMGEWRGNLNGKVDAGPALARNSASGYSPLMYLTSGAGVRFVKWRGGSVYWAVVAGRLCNLAFWLAAVFWAIKIAPVFQYAFLFAALLPMAVFQGMSLSADSFNNAVAYLFVAYGFWMAYSGQRIQARHVAFMGLLTVVGALSKGLIFPVGLWLLIPADKFRSGWKSKYGLFVLNLAAAMVLASVWSGMNEWFLHPSARVAADPDAQLRFMASNPGVFLSNLGVTIRLNAKYYWAQLIGCLGWQNAFFGVGFYGAVTGVFLSIFVMLRSSGVKWTHRALCMVLLGLYGMTLYVHLYRVWNPVGHPVIGGVLGRYFLPVLPLLFPVLSQSRIRIPAVVVSYYKAFLCLFLAGVQVAAASLLVERYWFAPYGVEPAAGGFALHPSEENSWVYREAWIVRRDWSSDGYFWEFNEEYGAWVGYQKASGSQRGTGWGIVAKGTAE
jgi:uncharacterized membrane protein